MPDDRQSIFEIIRAECFQDLNLSLYKGVNSTKRPQWVDLEIARIQAMYKQARLKSNNSQNKLNVK
jgi:hypothetical protein